MSNNTFDLNIYHKHYNTTCDCSFCRGYTCYKSSQKFSDSSSPCTVCLNRNTQICPLYICPAPPKPYCIYGRAICIHCNRCTPQKEKSDTDKLYDWVKNDPYRMFPVTPEMCPLGVYDNVCRRLIDDDPDNIQYMILNQDLIKYWATKWTDTNTIPFAITDVNTVINILNGNPDMLVHMPIDYLSIDIVLPAFKRAKNKDEILIFLPDDLQSNYQLQWYAVNTDLALFKLLREPATNIIMFVLGKNGTLIEYVNNPTTRMCQIAVQGNPKAFLSVPVSKKTADLYETFLYHPKTKSNLVLQAISAEDSYKWLTDELITKTIKLFPGSYAEFINNIPDDFDYVSLVSTYPQIFPLIPIEYRTEDVCLAIVNNKTVKSNGELIRYIPVQTEDIKNAVMLNFPDYVKYLSIIYMETFPFVIEISDEEPIIPIEPEEPTEPDDEDDPEDNP